MLTLLDGAPLALILAVLLTLAGSARRLRGRP